MCVRNLVDGKQLTQSCELMCEERVATLDAKVKHTLLQSFHKSNIALCLFTLSGDVNSDRLERLITERKGYLECLLYMARGYQYVVRLNHMVAELTQQGPEAKGEANRLLKYFGVNFPFVLKAFSVYGMSCHCSSLMFKTLVVLTGWRDVADQLKAKFLATKWVQVLAKLSVPVNDILSKGNFPDNVRSMCTSTCAIR